jgi:hypothetical protein
MIYFIRCGDDGPVKIGYTDNNISSRLACLQTSSPFKLKLIGRMDGSLEKEATLHKMFEHLRLEGEWFKPNDELLSFISEYRLSDEATEALYIIEDRIATFKQRFVPGTYVNLRQELKKLEMEIILDTIKFTGGNQYKAGLMLFKGKSEITQKLQRYRSIPHGDKD